ncbi:MAG: response regulator transcription factor [Ketobacteraceae bacterium]|nr:response regulator transcription factor [Ketobacteraceae bacterium]
MDDFHGRVLIVEDNADIASLLVDFFDDKGHVADCASDGLTGLHLISVNDYDVIILDLALPGIDGIDLCKKVRAALNKETPILMLTARDSLDEKLVGFDAGADDYLVKPFELLEVYARVQALWRRSLLSNRSLLQVADLSLDLRTLSVARNDHSIKLNPVRLKILRLLMENTHRVVSRREIESYVWGDEPTESDALRTHMSAIRQAIDKPFDTRLLHTIHGIGYRLYAESSA